MLDYNLNGNTMNLNNLNNSIPTSTPQMNNTFVPQFNTVPVTNPVPEVNSVPENIVQPPVTQEVNNISNNTVTTYNPLENNVGLSSEVQQMTTNVQLDQPPVVNNTFAETTAQINTPVVEEKPEFKSITTNELIINTDKLKTILSNIDKSIVIDPRKPLTSVTQLKFGKDGLEVIAMSDGNYLIQKDDSYKYVEEFSIGVSTDLFKNLISKIFCETIKLIFNKESRTITIEAEGTFTISEFYDTNEGSAINITLPEGVESVQLQKFDINALKTNLKMGIPFAGLLQSTPNLAGIYVDSYVYTTNKNIMSITKNSVDNLMDVYIPTHLAKIITTIDFGQDVSFGLFTSSSLAVPQFIISSETIVLVGSLMDNAYKAQYPTKALKNILEAEYPISVTVKRQKLIAALERLELFIGSVDESAFKFNIQNNILHLESMASNSKESVLLETTATQSLNIIKLDIRHTLLTLRNLTSDIVTIKADNNNDRNICISDSEAVVAVSILE